MKRIDKAKALEYQQQGMTYKEIAQTMQCSVSWCKHNLAQKNIPSELDRLVSIAEGKYGVSDTGISADTKKAIKRKSNKAVIRPAWMAKESPLASFYALCDMSLSLSDRLNECVSEYKQLFPNTNKDAIIAEMLRLAFPVFTREPIHRHIERTQEIAEELQYRRYRYVKKENRQGQS